MADRFPGGVISKTPPAVSGPAPGTGGAASGVWTLDEVLGYVQAGIWPGAALPFEYELYAWGSNGSGRLGDGTVDNRSSPVQVGALTTWFQVAAGESHTAAIKTDGTMWTWGFNLYAALGTGDLISQSSPVQVGALTNWAQISAHRGNCGSVKTDGTLWTWGDNSFGLLGINTTGGIFFGKSSPVQVGALTDWAQVSVGRQHMSAIKTTGTLWAWGGGSIDDNFGQMGTNERAVRSSPVQVGALTNWASVATNYQHTAAVKTDGTLWTWGKNTAGQLGASDTVTRSSPVQIGALTNWAQVAVGLQHTLAVKTTGSLWAWGYNGYGRLGDNTLTQRNSPVQIGALTDWRQATALSSVSAAVKTDGTLWTWGRGDYAGMLGQNDQISRSSPVQLGALTIWEQVSGISYSMSAITKGP